MAWQRYAADPLLADFAAREVGGARLLVRRGYDAFAERLAAGPVAAGTGMTVEGGRQPHPVLELARGERVVVREYRRGGMMRHLNGGRYFLGHRAFDELRVSERARAAGVSTPLVVAAAEYARRVGYGAALATVWVPDALELPRWLAGRGPAERAAVMGEVGRQVSRVHAGGVAHPDLNLRNLLISGGEAGGPRVYVLDFDRAQIFSGPVPAARRARDLLRLARSARKLAAPLGTPEWAAMRAGYGSAWPLRSDLG